MKKFFLLLSAIALVTPLYAGAQTAGQASLVCPSPTLTLDLARGPRTNDKTTDNQVSSLQVFLWQYKQLQPAWLFPQNREDFVSGSFGSRTEDVVKSFQKTFMGMTTGSVGYGKVGPLTRAEILKQCLPDIVVTNVISAESSVLIGNTLHIQYTRKNIGNTGSNAIATWDQMAYLSKDTVYDSADIPLPFTYSVSSYYLSPGWENTQNVSNKISSTTPAGQYYVIVREDIGGAPNNYPGILELNETNNWKSSSSTVLIAAPIIDTSIPSAPSYPTAIAYDHPARLLVLWQDNSNNENGFVVERSLYQNFASPIIATTTRANVTAFTDMNGLASSTTYYYRVRSFNGAGYSSYSNVVNVQTPPVVGTGTIPSAPSNTLALAGYGKPPYISLRWQDTSSNETKFLVEKSLSSTFSNYVTATSTRQNVTLFYDFNIASTTLYYYRVRACNAVGCSEPSNITSMLVAYVPEIRILAPTSAETYTTSASEVTLSALIIDHNKVGLATSSAMWNNTTTGNTGSVIPTIYGWAAQNPANAKFSVPLVPGENVITYKIADQKGYVGTDTIRVTYQPPTPSTTASGPTSYQPIVTNSGDLLGSIYDAFIGGATLFGNFLLRL